MFVRLWDVKTGKTLKEHALRPTGTDLRDPDEPNAKTKQYRQGKGGAIERSIFTSNASRFVLNFDRALYVFDVTTGKEVFKIDNEVGFLASSMASSPDGRRLLTSTTRDGRTVLPNGSIRYSEVKDHTVQLWDLTNGKQLRKLVLPQQFAGPVAFSRDGKLMAEVSGRSPSTVRVWETETARELLTINNAPQVWRGQTLAFSPDDKMLAYGSVDCTALIWDITSR